MNTHKCFARCVMCMNATKAKQFKYIFLSLLFLCANESYLLSILFFILKYRSVISQPSGIVALFIFILHMYCCCWLFPGEVLDGIYALSQLFVFHSILFALAFSVITSKKYEMYSSEMVGFSPFRRKLLAPL